MRIPQVASEASARVKTGRLTVMPPAGRGHAFVAATLRFGVACSTRYQPAPKRRGKNRRPPPRMGAAMKQHSKFVLIPSACGIAWLSLTAGGCDAGERPDGELRSEADADPDDAELTAEPPEYVWAHISNRLRGLGVRRKSA